MDTIKKKAGFFKRWRKHVRYNRAKADFLDAFNTLAPITQEEELKRLVKDAAPDYHIHLNPKKGWPA